MHLLRCFAFFVAFFKFNYSTQHVPRVLNTAANALSRDDLTLFFSLVPQTPRYTLPLPPARVNHRFATRLGLDDLDISVRSLIGCGIAKSTLASYESGKRRYLAFCTQFSLPPLPVSESTPCRFVAALHSDKLSFSGSEALLVCCPSFTGHQWSPRSLFLFIPMPGICAAGAPAFFTSPFPSSASTSYPRCASCHLFCLVSRPTILRQNHVMGIVLPRFFRFLPIGRAHLSFPGGISA